jgi:hypothetical protein
MTQLEQFGQMLTQIHPVLQERIGIEYGSDESGQFPCTTGEVRLVYVNEIAEVKFCFNAQGSLVDILGPKKV